MPRYMVVRKYFLDADSKEEAHQKVNVDPEEFLDTEQFRVLESKEKSLVEEVVSQVTGLYPKK